MAPVQTNSARSADSNLFSAVFGRRAVVSTEPAMGHELDSRSSRDAP